MFHMVNHGKSTIFKSGTSSEIIELNGPSASVASMVSMESEHRSPIPNGPNVKRVGQIRSCNSGLIDVKQIFYLFWVVLGYIYND